MRSSEAFCKMSPKGYSEEQLKIAIEQVNSGVSIRQAAIENQIPRTTLSSRLQSNSEGPISAGRPTFLSSAEEQIIADWAIRRAVICCPVTKRELLDMIEQLCNKLNKCTKFQSNRPSESWFYRFQQRHQLSLRRSEELDGGRTRVSKYSSSACWYVSFYV